MSEQENSINWETGTREKLELMIGKVPVFLRGVAEEKVSKRAENLVRETNRSLVVEKDLVDAFFEETPFGFHGPMKSDMKDLNINYIQYGHPA